MHIREALITDADDIAEIIIAAWQHGFDGLIDSSFPKAMSKKNFADISLEAIRDQAEKVYVYTQDNAIVGYISGRVLSGKYDSEVRGLYVSPKAQGGGIGRKLLEEMKSHFRGKNCETMLIWTLLNATNNQFYSNHGGRKMEARELEIGNRKYAGVGFCFDL